MPTFTTTIYKDPDGSGTGIVVPPEIITGFDKGKRPPVRVTINGYTYRSTVAVMGGEFMIPLAAEHRNAAGVQGGQETDVTLELDDEPRTVAVPDDLAQALDAVSGARAAFDALAYSARKEFVRHVNDAKAEATRQRRIASIVAKVSGS